MTTVGDIVRDLEKMAPPNLALDWDNVGLQAGRRDAFVTKVYVALDVTEAVLFEAAEKGCELIVTHHPLIFGKISKVNDDEHLGNWILTMAENGISCFSMHTNYDIAPGCMADICAERIGLNVERPLEVTGPEVGIGSVGSMPCYMTVGELARHVKKAFELPFVTLYTADENAPVAKAAVCPGSAKGMAGEALLAGCNVLIGGDMGHHDGIDAVAEGLSLINAGHYGLEHVFVESVAEHLNKNFPDIKVFQAPLNVPEKLV